VKSVSKQDAKDNAKQNPEDNDSLKLKPVRVPIAQKIDLSIEEEDTDASKTPLTYIFLSVKNAVRSYLR
jgi:hypothetical protein